MVACRQRLLDGRLAAIRIEACEQHRGLDLRARDRKLVRDRRAATSLRSRSAHGRPPSRSKRPSGGAAPRRAPSAASSATRRRSARSGPAGRRGSRAGAASACLRCRSRSAAVGAVSPRRPPPKTRSVSVVGLVDADAERADRCDRRLGVGRAAEAGDARLAVGDRAEEHCPVRDRLVAGDASARGRPPRARSSSRDRLWKKSCEKVATRTRPRGTCPGTDPGRVPGEPCL